MANKEDRKQDRKQLYLLDAMALAYRSHFIFISRPLVNSKGQNTSAAYGFTSALLKLIEDHKIEHIAVVFDVMDEGGTFRDELYEDYKANRDPAPEELIENLPRIKQVVEAFDIPVFEIGGVEADDVIGTLARKAEQEDAEVVIVSPDKDFQQLISDRITLFRPAYRGEDFDPITVESFKTKWGVDPIQFIDIQALWGDSTDNVPGIPGIGEKTATKLIQEYGSIEKLLEHAEDVKGKRAREGLLQFPDQARLSKELVSIKTDLDVPLDWSQLHQARPNAALIRQAFREFEFNTLLRRTERILGLNDAGAVQPSLFTTQGPEGDIPGGGDGSAPEVAAELSEPEMQHHLVTTREKLDDVLTAVSSISRLAVNTVLTDDVNPMDAGLVGIAIGDDSQQWYVPMPLLDGTSTADVLGILKPILESDVPKVGHDLKPGLVALRRAGVTYGGDLFDTMIAHYLCAPEQPHDLPRMSATELGVRVPPLSGLLGSGRAKKNLVDLAAADVGEVVCAGVSVAARLADALLVRIEKDGVGDVVRNMEFPLIRVLADIEQNGILVDTAVLSEISEDMRVQLGQLETEIFEAAGEEFNIGSPAQLGEVLFERLGLPVISKTSTGKASTRESVLQELAAQHELPALILDWRELSKLKSTYIDSLPTLVHPETGRIHTTYNQTATATGRLSSQNPNLQNIPVRTARGREIRRAFVAEDGFQLLAADYVQIELRILASMSGDSGLKEAFEKGIDIHTATAARMFGIDPADVTRAQRSRAKEVNYGIPYGISAFGLAQRLRCSRAEGQELIDGYNKSYADVAGFLRKQVELVRDKGFAETLLGRRRYIPDINARNRVQRAAAERIAFNMPIQGTQADMIKLAMIAIHKQLSDLRSRMLLQVHDELVFEVAEGEEETLQELVRTEMINALPLDVPIEVEISIADNWLDAH